MNILKVVDSEGLLVNRTVLRISTGYWSSSNGLHFKKDLKFLKKKSHGMNFLMEDAECIGVEEALSSIVNLHECSDGLYKFVVHNWTTDWETGTIDSVTWKLVPFEGK